MREVIRKLAVSMQLWLYRSCEVGQFEGIRLADFAKRANPTSPFLDILLASLHLLKKTDPHHFRRVRKYLSWVVSRTLSVRGLAKYNHPTRGCEIDFIPPSAEYDAEWLIGMYACTLIHEATHGKIESLGIRYTPKLRARIERLCVKEEQCFLLRLTITQPDLAERLYREFDASKWKEYWDMTGSKRLRAELQRALFPEREG